MEIGRYSITFKESLTFWDYETLRYEPAFQDAPEQPKEQATPQITKDQLETLEMVGGMMMRSKVKVWGRVISEIKEGDKKVTFSEDWVKGLTKEEGETIDEQVKEVCKKK